MVNEVRSKRSNESFTTLSILVAGSAREGLERLPHRTHRFWAGWARSMSGKPDPAFSAGARPNTNSGF